MILRFPNICFEKIYIIFCDNAQHKGKRMNLPPSYTSGFYYTAESPW